MKAGGKNLQRIATLELEMDPKGHLIKPAIGCQIPFYCGPDKWPSEVIWQQGVHKLKEHSTTEILSPGNPYPAFLTIFPKTSVLCLLILTTIL